MTHPLRCEIIECCGKCRHSAYRSPDTQFCNHPKFTGWKEKLNQWTDGISSCCPLPIYNPQFTQDELSDLFIIVDANIYLHGNDTDTLKLLHKIEALRQGGE